MAKKPSSKARKNKRSVDKSAAKGGGIMSINKSNTSLGMKIVLIILIVSFVLLFSYGGITGFIDLFNKQPQSQTATLDTIAQIKNQYDPQVKAFTTALASSPTSYTLLVDLGNAHYDYAIKLMQASQTTTAALLPAASQWTQAKAAFAKAIKVHKQLEKAVGVDYAVAQFYSGETTAAIKTALSVTKIDPAFAPASYNLGMFYEAQGNKALSISAFQRYLVLDPKGVTGNRDYARQELTSLGGTIPATGSVAPSGVSSATTP